MPSTFFRPPVRNPVDIFGRDSPIAPGFWTQLMGTVLPAPPDDATASPSRAAEFRLAAMLAIAAAQDGGPEPPDGPGLPEAAGEREPAAWPAFLAVAEAR